MLARKKSMTRSGFKPAVFGAVRTTVEQKTEVQPKPPKARKCAVKSCRKQFMPDKPFVVWCSEDCGAEIAQVKLAKAKAAQSAAAKRAKKAERAQDREKRESLKKLSDYKKEAQAAWNSYVRARDYGKPCISCGATPKEAFGGTMDCSHYRSRGAAPHLAFHLHNAAAACVKCNRYLGGNVVALRAGLVERIGEEKVLAIEANNQVRKFSKEYLIRIKSIFTKKARRQKLRNDHES